MTRNNPTLVLITADPNHPLALHAYRYVKALLASSHIQVSQNTQNGKDTVISNTDTKKTMAVAVFFYADAAHTANQLRWQVADRANLTELWQQLSTEYQLPLPVCVSTAVTRGITDSDNAKRHQLSGANLAPNFTLVGLGELATTLKHAKKVIQF